MNRDWQQRALQIGGIECGKCGAWRRLCDDYFLERCRGCGDAEVFLFDNNEPEQSGAVLNPKHPQKKTQSK